MPEPDDKAPVENEGTEEAEAPEVIAHEGEDQELPWCADNQCAGNSVD